MFTVLLTGVGSFLPGKANLGVTVAEASSDAHGEEAKAEIAIPEGSPSAAYGLSWLS